MPMVTRCVIVPLLLPQWAAPCRCVHMDVRGNDLVEYILKLAEILLDVSLDGLHLLLGVDFGITEFFLILRVLIVWVDRQLSSSGSSSFIGSVTDFQGHLFFWQRDTRGCG